MTASAEGSGCSSRYRCFSHTRLCVVRESGMKFSFGGREQQDKGAAGDPTSDQASRYGVLRGHCSGASGASALGYGIPNNRRLVQGGLKSTIILRDGKRLLFYENFGTLWIELDAIDLRCATPASVCTSLLPARAGGSQPQSGSGRRGPGRRAAQVADRSAGHGGERARRRR